MLSNSIDRKMFYEGLPAPHENRFIKFNILPDVDGKYAKSGAPDFNRYAMREMLKDKNIMSKFSRVKPLPDYNPNKEYTQRSLSVGLTPFEK